MTLLRAVLLGILQGATEFVPVSSSGHLVLVPWALGWPNPSLAFDAVAHLGTLVAVLAYFWADIIALWRGWVRSVRERRLDTTEGRLAWLILISAIPGALLGVFLEDWFEALFASPHAVALLLLVTGVILYVSDRLARGSRLLGDVSLVDALLIGLAQGVAIAPGISRSGATISTGLLRGLDRDSAARFSFLMGIPIVAGAAAFSLLDVVQAGAVATEWYTLAVGFLAAAASGYLGIRYLLRYLRSHTLRPFAYYCWAAGLIGLLLYGARAGMGG